MSTLARRGLPPDLQYIIDGACDAHEILGHHHFALWNYGDPDRIDAIFNEPCRAGSGRSFMRGRRLGCMGLIAYADEIIAQMDPVEREAMAVFAYNHADRIVVEYAEFMAGWNFEDTIKGGCAIPFRDVLHGTRDGIPSPRAARRLKGPKAIRRYVKGGSYEWGWLRDVVASVLNIPAPASRDLSEAFVRRDDEMRAARRVAERAAMERFRIEHATKPYKVVKPQERRRRQSVVKRAAVMAAAMLGASTVSAFARGEPVRIAGQDIVFEFRSASRLDAMGHGGVDVALLSNDGKRLSKICVYHDKTPALDQLTAFALRIAAGDEQEIIKTGNLFALEGAAADHPVLMQRIKEKAETPAHGVVAGPARVNRWHRNDDELFRARCAAYCVETSGIYRRAVAEVLFGRRADQFVSAARSEKEPG